MSDPRGYTKFEQVALAAGGMMVAALVAGFVSFLIEQGRDDVRIEGISSIQEQVVENREKRGEMISNLRDALQAQISDLRERVATLEGAEHEEDTRQ